MDIARESGPGRGFSGARTEEQGRATHGADEAALRRLREAGIQRLAFVAIRRRVADFHEFLRSEEGDPRGSWRNLLTAVRDERGATLYVCADCERKAVS